MNPSDFAFRETARLSCPTRGGLKKTNRSFERLPFEAHAERGSRLDMASFEVGGGARATGAGRATHLQNTEPGMPAFQRLMSVYSAEAMVASGVFPGSDPMNPMRTAVLCRSSRNTRRQRGRHAKGNEQSAGGARARRARGEALASPAATCSRENIERKRGRAPRSTRAPRAFAGCASSCRHFVTSKAGPYLARVRQKARGGDARRRRGRASATATRGRGRGHVEGSRISSHFGVRKKKTDAVAHALGDFAGAHESSFMPQHVNRGVLKHSTRGCGSGREGNKRSAKKVQNARDLRDIASMFDRDHLGSVLRLACTESRRIRPGKPFPSQHEKCL